MLVNYSEEVGGESRPGGVRVRSKEKKVPIGAEESVIDCLKVCLVIEVGSFWRGIWCGSLRLSRNRS